METKRAPYKQAHVDLHGFVLPQSTIAIAMNATEVEARGDGIPQLTDAIAR